MNKAGRNDPCPCGSGKKFKHCCQHRQGGAVHAVKSTPMDASIQQSLQMAVEHHRAGRLHQAEAIYRKILQAAPNQSDALHLLGMVANQRGQNDIAADLIGKAIKIHPASPMYYNLGNVFREQGKLDAAVENFQMVLKLDPGYANAYLNMGVVLNEQGKLDAAAENFRKTLKLKPDFVDAHFHLGNVCHVQGKLEAAAECFHKVLKLKPGYAEAHINLGNVLKDQGRLDEAIESFRKALSFNPNFAEAHGNLGNALQDQGKLEEAIACYRQALAHSPIISPIATEIRSRCRQHSEP